MNKIIEACICKLTADDALKGNTLGMLIPEILFRDIDCALIIDNEDKTYHILGRENNLEAMRIRVTCLLAELINELDYLHSENLIYYLGYKDDSLQIVSSFTNDLYKTSTTGEYSCGSNLTLSKCDGSYVIKQNGKVEYLSIEADTVLYCKVHEIMSSCFFPTTKLSEYINRGFCTEDRYIAKKSLDSSKCSLRLAFLIAILSPFLALLLSNLWGVTKIDSKQFNSLNKLTTIHDTLIVHDTIFEQKVDISFNDAK